MKDVIDKLDETLIARVSELKVRLGELAMEDDLEKLQSIREQAKELERGRDLLRAAEQCITGAERKLELLLRTHTKAPPTVLRIKLCWSKLGLPGADDIIEERMAADALPRLFELLAEKMGAQVLERAGQVMHGDRPLLSRRPAQEWINPNSGAPYASKVIGHTGWYVITHSSTRQKIEQIEALARSLGIPLGTIQAEAVARQPN